MNISNQYLKAWLSFNTSPTEDAKMNNWQTYGNPTIGTANAFNGKALQLDGQSYLKLSGVELGGRDFYIDGWVYVDSASPANARIISIVNPSNGRHLVSVRKSSSNADRIDFWRNSTADVSVDNGYTATPSVTSVGTRVHFKLIYRYTDKIFHLCINDNQYVGASGVIRYNRQYFDIYIGALSNGGQGLIGTIDELRIYDGTWFSYAYKNPPTLAEYQNISFTADTERNIHITNLPVSLNFDAERKILNAPLNWRYENFGTADLLSISGTTLTDLPVTQSITGSAFWQSTRAKCFDIPNTKEIWIKFDVFTTLATRWRAYNDNSNGVNGICSQTASNLSLFVGNGSSIYNDSGVVKNQLQTFLLHMASDSATGIVEAWCDGVKIYTYTGNVNNGEDFADFYLESDGADTFFSNVIISNVEIALNENVVLGLLKTWTFDTSRVIQNAQLTNISFAADAQRQLVRSVNFNFDAERIVEHSRLWIQPVLTANGAVGDELAVYAGFKTFGIVEYGDAYKAFDNSTGTYIDRMRREAWLQFVTKQTIQINAITITSNGNEFLPITGIFQVSYDNGVTWTRAGTWTFSGTGNSANIVFDNGSVTGNYFRLLATGSCAKGTGYDANICNVRITAILKSWIFDAERIVQNDSFNARVNAATKLLLHFDDDNDPYKDECGNTLTVTGTPALTSTNAKFGKALNFPSGDQYLNLNSLQLGGQDFTIDCWAFINTSGSIFSSALCNVYADNISSGGLRLGYNFRSPSTYGSVSYKTGINVIGSLHHFEVVYQHNIQALSLFLDGVKVAKVSSADYIQMQRGNIELYIGSEGLTVDEFRVVDDYALHTNNFTPPTAPYSFSVQFLNINFDTARKLQKIVTAYFYTARLLSKHFNFNFDAQRIIEYSDVSTSLNFDAERIINRSVNTNFDAIRNLAHKLFITPAQNGIIYSDFIDTPNIQSIELNLAVQQITDRLSFTSTSRAEIMQQVKGQILDYQFDMRIESKTTRGILTTCHCCSDIDQLLFTQIAYKTSKRVGGIYAVNDKKEVTMIEKPKAPASSHIEAIANVLGKQTVLLFDDFTSTVDIEQEGVTYDDLIREIFGWSARVPQRLINCYIRNDTLYVIQRGHEQNIINLTGTKHTLPVIDEKLVRTTWNATHTTNITTKTNGQKIYGLEPILGGIIDENPEEPEPKEPKEPRRVLPEQTIINENGVETTIDYEYDDDGNVIKTTTTTDNSMTVVENEYVFVDGRKYLEKETTTVWEGSKLVDQKIIHHDYLTQGQQNSTGIDSDGNPFHSGATPALLDVRPTPFEEMKYGPSEAMKALFDKLKTYTYDSNGNKVEILGHKPVTKEVPGTEIEIPGILLVDSSFPIDGNAFLATLTDAIIWLNRKTQEIISFDLFDYPHIIDFNDRIIFNGNEYFLENNTAVKTPRIVNKQSLQLIRWY